MSITAKGEYACLAMMELARRYSDPKPARLVEIATDHAIPQRFLVQILLQMKAASLVATVRGASGGYRLTRPPEKISLADILDVADRQSGDDYSGKSGGPLVRNLRSVWKKLDQSRLTILKGTTLASLIPKNEVIDYSI